MRFRKTSRFRLKYLNVSSQTPGNVSVFVCCTCGLMVTSRLKHLILSPQTQNKYPVVSLYKYWTTIFNSGVWLPSTGDVNVICRSLMFNILFSRLKRINLFCWCGRVRENTEDLSDAYFLSLSEGSCGKFLLWCEIFKLYSVSFILTDVDFCGSTAGLFCCLTT